VPGVLAAADRPGRHGDGSGQSTAQNGDSAGHLTEPTAANAGGAAAG
jgi:hypothetical protein